MRLTEIITHQKEVNSSMQKIKLEEKLYNILNIVFNLTLSLFYYYWHFIQDFSKLVRLFIDFTKKYTLFDKISTYQSDFDNLKRMFIKALILIHYKQDLRTIVETDSSNYISNRDFS